MIRQFLLSCFAIVFATGCNPSSIPAKYSELSVASTLSPEPRIDRLADLNGSIVLGQSQINRSDRDGKVAPFATQTLARRFAEGRYIYGIANGTPMVIDSVFIDENNFVARGWLANGVGCRELDFPGSGARAVVDLRNMTLTLSHQEGVSAVGALLVQDGRIGGVQVLKLRTKMTINGKSLELIGNVSVDPVNDFRLYRYCPDAGFDPGVVEALTTIQGKVHAIAWLDSKGWDLNKRYSDDSTANHIFISVPVGFEYDAIAEIKKQPFFLDVTRVALPAGPSDVALEFPIASLLTKSTTVESIRLKLEGLVHDFVDADNARIEAITTGNGYSYSVNIETPVTSLGIKGYEGWWLKFKLNLLFDRVFEPDAIRPVDRVTIQIPDGYLAKWPEGRSVAPPTGHYDHLDEGGDGRFKSFMLLRAIQEHVATRLRTAWVK